jgi:nicotinate phosphoribosyltransferase
MVRDVIGRHDEAVEGEPLLRPVMRDGVRLAAGRVGLEEARAQARGELERLPEALRSLASAAVPYRVEISPALQADHEALRRTLEAAQSG